MGKISEGSTLKYICSLSEEIQKEIFLTLQERLLTEGSEVDDYDIADMMNYRLCDIYDNETIMYSEILAWSKNMSIN